MRDIPPNLQAHLDGAATTLCWCWRLTRADGRLLGFTDHDRDLSFDGTLFQAATGFTASEIKESVGLSVDNLDVTAALSAETLTEADLAAGLYDDARIEIWRVNWAAPDERVLMRTGSLGEVRRGETAFTAEVRGLAHYLNQDKGRTFQYGCDADLGDQRCGVDLSSSAYRGAGVVASVLAPHRLMVTGLHDFAEGWFSGGLLAWVSGANAGRKMEVKRHSKSEAGAVTLELWHAMAEEVAVGDAFNVTAGCDKSFAICKTKFANAINFRGFPHIPGNGYVMAYAGAGDATNNGESIVA